MLFQCIMNDKQRLTAALLYVKILTEGDEDA